MAMGKYSRVDGRKSSNYGLTITIVAFVMFCLVGAWMLMSSSGVQLQNVSTSSEETPRETPTHEVERTVTDSEPNMVTDGESNTVNDSEPKQFEDSSGDVPDDARKDEGHEAQRSESENRVEIKKEEDNTDIGDTTTEKRGDDSEKNSSDENPDAKVETKSESKEAEVEINETNKDDEVKLKESSEENKAETDEIEKNTESEDQEKQEIEKVNQTEESNPEQSNNDGNKGNQENDQASNEVFPAGDQAEIMKESKAGNGSWSTQAAESQNEKKSQESSSSKSFSWKLCNSTAGPDFIPCLDNWEAIMKLHSRSHYEHRERHCPEEPPTCLVPMPEGYRRPIKWPKSREKIWYTNVPHTKLAEIKGHQNWVKFSGEYLIFPGGGTQFVKGALHYIDTLQSAYPDIAWGKRTRVILDVGCGVASFGGFLFERDVLAMSFAPKDEHEAQVQFALERGIPSVSNVMGTRRLPYPGSVFDLVHCARCRVPWHVDGGKLLLELNRVLRPGGYFVWSATPVYRKDPENTGIWKAMTKLTKSMCWDLVTVEKDDLNQVASAIYQKPTSNKCYNNRTENEPPLCNDSDDPNAAWNVPLEGCMHKIPEDESKRGAIWPEQWPKRLETPPYWLESQVGVYGKAAPEDFTADYEHWKNVVSQSYLKGMGINWSNVRNVMDMRAVYGGFAAALKDMNVWVMNVVPIDSADTLPIIYERGLFGMYHDWCESFNTYPRTYDLLHADHLFSHLKKRCNLVAVFVEVDRILRPQGRFIMRDNVETVNEVEKLARSMQWEVRMTYSKDNEGLLSVQKSWWRPTESQTLKYAIA